MPFRVNKVGATGGVCANVPQAISLFCRIFFTRTGVHFARKCSKGRVERANGTLQDRLVNELRLAGISSIEAGNAFLPASWRISTGASPRSRSTDGLAEPDAVIRQVAVHSRADAGDAAPRPPARNDLRPSRWPVCDPASSLDLPYRTFDELQQVDQAAIVENKRQRLALAYIAERQKELNMARGGRAPRQQGRARASSRRASKAGQPDDRWCLRWVASSHSICREMSTFAAEFCDRRSAGRSMPLVIGARIRSCATM
ncbi:hypothetical protein SAMN05216304_101761 [Bosea sp. OK403]|nr:hypothetical protein SAMN05216304_101761 [Bosea sp. OK403]